MKSSKRQYRSISVPAYWDKNASQFYRSQKQPRTESRNWIRWKANLTRGRISEPVFVCMRLLLTWVKYKEKFQWQQISKRNSNLCLTKRGKTLKYLNESWWSLKAEKTVWGGKVPKDWGVVSGLEQQWKFPCDLAKSVFLGKKSSNALNEHYDV